MPHGISGHIAAWTDICTTRPTGYLVPPEGGYRLCIPGNYFDEEVSAEAAGIIATLFVLNQLCWTVSEMGPEYALTCQGLADRQDALKDYVRPGTQPDFPHNRLNTGPSLSNRATTGACHDPTINDGGRAGETGPVA